MRILNGLTLSENTSEFFRGDGIFAVPPGGGGGSSQLVVTLVADSVAAAWSNMPLAATLFNGSHRHVTKVDLTNFSEVRFIVNKQATAGAAASILALMYATSFSTLPAGYSQIGTSAVQVAVNVQNSIQVTSWIPLAEAAKSDVFIAVVGSGGDGVLDPTFGVIAAQFR